MPNPFSEDRKPKPPKEKQSCTEKRGLAHRWLLDDPEGPEVVGRCIYCRRKRVFSAYMRSSEVYAGRAVVSDPLPRRTNVGEAW